MVGSAELPAASQRTDRLWSGAWRRQGPREVQREIVGDVEVGSPAIQMSVEPRQGGDGIQELSAIDGGGSRVDALAPGISAVELKPMADAFGELSHSSVADYLP